MEIILTKSTTTAWCIKQLDRIFAKFGFPHVLVSYNGTQLTSKTFEDYLQKYMILHWTIAPFYSQSNGQAERTVQTVKSLIHACDPINNDDKLNKILKQLRIAQNAATGTSSYKLIFRRDIRTELEFMVEDTLTQLQTRIIFSGSDYISKKPLIKLKRKVVDWNNHSAPTRKYVMYIVKVTMDRSEKDISIN